MDCVELNNGIKMPLEGVGVFQIQEQETCERITMQALEAGYRLVDTASSYFNEEAVGRAIRKSGLPREELFVTTKVWVQDMGYENTLRAFENSMEKLGLEYLDLYLIHKPFGDYYGSWRAMEELCEKGKIRAIGVSNFAPDRLYDLWWNSKIKPAVDQVECHPYFQQKPLLATVSELNVRVQAWAPFAEGSRGIFEDQVLNEIARAHQRTAAQVMLRWNVQRGVIVIPKTSRPERLAENLNIWDFRLSDEEMERIGELDAGRRGMVDHTSPKYMKRLFNYKIHD